jgi:hypothetical protein
MENTNAAVEIRVRGHLDADWTEWFFGLDFSYTDTGDTVLNGFIPDQAALYGLIARLRDLGVQLISVNIDLPAQSRIRSKDP